MRKLLTIIFLLPLILHAQIITVHPGSNQVITLPVNQVTLNGAATGGTGRLTYHWTKVGNGSPSPGKIAAVNSAITTVKSLVYGVYTFQLKVSDTHGHSTLGTMTVTVNNLAIPPPIVHAGNDTTYIAGSFPVTTLLSGTATSTGTIISTKWIQISGTTSSIISTTSLSTHAIDSSAGTYTYQLSAMDNDSSISIDTVQITVIVPNIPPVAHAGIDQLINTTSTTLIGTGTDVDGTVTGYMWTKISGPSTYTLNTPSLGTTTITNLVVGVYQFQLQVTDNQGATGKDTVQITVVSGTVLQARAGNDTTILRGRGFYILNGSGSTGTIDSSKWQCITPTNDSSNCRIGDSTQLINYVHTLPYRNPTYYDFKLTIYDNAGDSSMDTVRVNIAWGTPLPPQQTNWRYLTSADVIPAINPVPNGIVGAIYLDGANTSNFGDIGGLHTDIYIDSTSTSNWHLGPDQKILIKAGIYGIINISFKANAIRGAPGHPVLLTNSGGQVEYVYMRIGQVKGIRITGQYVKGITGDINYQGAQNGYAFTQTTYGLYGNERWQSTQQPVFAMVGSNVTGFDNSTDSIEIDHTANGNGGFCGMWLKSPTVSNDWVMNEHDNYVFNTFGEGIYETQTDNQPTSHHKLTAKNNRSFNAGNEGFQWGNLASGSEIAYNFVLFPGSRGRSPFQDAQSTGIQTQFDNGGISFHHNVVSGAYGQVFSFFTSYRTGDALITDSIRIYNNLSQWGKSHIGNFFDNDGALTGVPISIWGNYFGNYTGNAIEDSIFVSPPTNTNQLIQVAMNVSDNPHFYMNHNYRDASKSTLIANTGGATVDTTSNSFIAQLPRLRGNLGFDSTSDLSNYGMWTDRVYGTLGDEFLQQRLKAGVKQYDKTWIHSGDMINWLGVFYTCNVTNTGHMPTGVTDTYYTVKTWTKLNGIVTTEPPFDPRDSVSHFYGKLGIGLLDTLGGIHINQPPIVNAGSDQNITLPANSVLLNGIATDLDGTITGVTWAKLIGPSGGSIISPTSDSTTISGLIAGTYSYQFSGTDNSGSTTRDTINIVVNPATPYTTQFNIKVNSGAGMWNCMVHLPADYSTTKVYPTIIFFPGLGEVGTDSSKVILNGPGAYLAQGWNGNVTISGTTTEFIIISVQPQAAYPTEVYINNVLQVLKGLYQINPNKLLLTGLSEGGWMCTTFVTGDPYGGPYTYAAQVRAIVNVEGVKPDDNSPYPNLFDNYALGGGQGIGGRLANFEQLNDGRDMPTYTARMNAARPGSAIYTQTNFGAGNHCCWANFYGGQGTIPTLFMLDGVTEDIYHWFANQ